MNFQLKRTLEPTHMPSPKTFAEIPSSMERAAELRAQAFELRKFASERKIEHFASEYYRRELRMIRASLDVGTELRIIQEAERMEEEALFMETVIKQKNARTTNQTKPKKVYRNIKAHGVNIPKFSK